MEAGVFLGCRSSRVLYSACFSLLTLLSTSQAPLSMATKVVLPGGGEFHPSRVLSTYSLTANLSPSSSSPSERKTRKSSRTMSGGEIREDEVMYHFYRNGGSKQDYRKPSTAFMVSLFNDLLRGRTITNGNRFEAVTDTIRSFSGNTREARNGKPVIDFYIPYLPPLERLSRAEIRFMRHPNNRVASRKYKFRIDVKKNGKIVNKVVVRERSITQYEYDVFDVTQIVSPWINDYHGNMSLHIRVSKKLQSQTLVVFKDTSLRSTSLIVLYLEDREFLKNMYTSFTSVSDSTEDSDIASFRDSSPVSNSRHKRAYMQYNDSFLASSNITSLSRSKRDTKKRKRRNRKNKKWYKAGRKENCQMYDFEVDFNAIGWGQWIIHPKRFNARFCFGKCPSPIDVKYNPTNHAMLQTLMGMKKPNIAPVPCCVPTELDAVSMLYFEYDEIVVRHHEDMVAHQCGCR